MSNNETGFEAVIGLEVHCQLSTNTKIFCGCPARATAEDGTSELDVNVHVCPICAGHPGVLPVLNEKVVEFAVKAGLATNCEIRKHNVFSRKNYFYPDLPKGYQISQYDLPICEYGHLNIETSKGAKKISIRRIHMEEDAGKNVHMSGFSLVNLNRAGVPLIEIVSGPDMRSAEEAGAYLRALHAVVTYLGICDGNMQDGNFRCDANVSVRPRGQEKFGTRAEIKNVNSFRFVEKAIEFEIHRQIELIQAGGKVVQETRGYDSAKGQTFSQRTKEEAEDYRYFPEPDLISVSLDDSYLERVRRTLPELPEQKRQRYVSQLGLTAYDAAVLTGSQSAANLFEAVLKTLGGEAAALAKSVANLLTGEVARLVNEEGIEIPQSKLTAAHVADVARASAKQEISSTAAKLIIATAWKTGESVSAIIDREGLRQVSDTGALEKAVVEVIAANAGQFAEFKSGKDKLLGFFVGQVMKATGGKANPGVVQEIIRKKAKEGT